MDFWGFDRSHRSLRLDSLERILDSPQETDINRLGSVVPPIIGSTPLTTQEIEVLTALAHGASNNPSIYQGPITETLKNVLLSTPELALRVPTNFSYPAREVFFQRVGSCPTRSISKSLTSFFLKCDNSEIVFTFLNKFEHVWAGCTASTVVAMLGSLLGVLEGIIKTETPSAVNTHFIKQIHRFCEPEFLASAHAKLSENSATSNVSVAQLRIDVAEVSALFAPVASVDELTVLSDLAVVQLERLESSHEFHNRADLDESLLIEGAMFAYLKVLRHAFASNQIQLGVIMPVVQRALGDPTLQHPDLVVTIGELAAEVIGDDEQRFFMILELLPEFFGGLGSSTAYHSARQFADIFKRNFVTESSHVKVLYTISNKLNSEEFSVYATAHGDLEAVALVSALLSALMAFVVAFNSHELAGLLFTLLDQKFGVINDQVDAQIIETWGLLSQYLTKEKFGELLEQLVQATKPDNPKILQAIKNARISIANKCNDSSLYLEHLLNLLIIKGDPSYSSLANGVFAPLAVLVSKQHPDFHKDSKLQETSRNAWFSLASMGFTIDSLGPEDLRNLSTIAKWTPPLVSEASVSRIDSDIQLNPVLFRGTNSEVLKIQKIALSKVDSRIVPHNSPPKTMFMAATLLLEGLRIRAGVISCLPHYFLESDFSSGDGYSQMYHLVTYLAHQHVRAVGNDTAYTLADISSEVKQLLVLACHRLESVRKVATELVTLEISKVPASLCQNEALFTLFDCVTLLGDSINNAIEDEYSPKAVFGSHTSNVTLELSDNLDVRKQALNAFEEASRGWVALISKKLGPELKSRVCTYIGNSQNSGRGRKFALNILSSDDASDDFMSQYLLLNRYDTHVSGDSVSDVIHQLQSVSTLDELNDAYLAAGQFIRGAVEDNTVVVAQESVKASFRIFTDPAISAGLVFWLHITRHQPTLRPVIINEVTEQCILTAHNRRGVFSRELDEVTPLWSEMEYAPTNKKTMDRHDHAIKELFAPHSRLLTEVLRSSFHDSVLLSPLYVPMFTRLAFSWLNALINHGSLHSTARNLRYQILDFVVEIVNTLQLLAKSMVALKPITMKLEREIYRAGLSWFEQPVCQWSYGSNSRTERLSLRLIRKTLAFASRGKTPESELLCEFLSQEFNKLSTWHDPLGNSVTRLPTRGFSISELQLCWKVNPILIVRIAQTWQVTTAHEQRWIQEVVEQNPLSFIKCEEALHVYLDNRETPKTDLSVIYWTQVSPIASINLLSPRFGRNMAITQLALRSLQSHPITKCFFYVPQIVQQLRHDQSGWVEEYILEAAKFSQKFAHQIIWNIMANMYNDDDGTVPNEMKPKLDMVLEKMKTHFTPEEKDYYETEFRFFSEVTGISGKLKPYIKRSKPEKKAKIDEEMAKIEVPNGVYLPSHPDGTVIDIDRLSGKPLQSHAKAPFMATFKLRTDTEVTDDKDEFAVQKTTAEIWQSAIFKVGDDCRQDVLALQVISVFRSIFNYCGLDVFVFPYKVTATAAGRGIIDVLPNSISRDMLGREAVNGLDQWFRSKYGGPESIDFQRARLNFVKSMAAYSVISYLIQFKDRHNGNIMYDADGHVIHIDFGFCFDIVPGGVKFEAAPFKLTKEMVQVMGGSSKALPYKWFEELCVRAFLASRVFADDICRVVEPMLESGLPCFKGHTIKRMRERFALQKSEAEAAHFMRSLIAKSHESNYTKGYDEFQRITNGIPH